MAPDGSKFDAGYVVTRTPAEATGVGAASHDADATDARLDRLTRLAHNLDGRFRVPGTNIRFGWDSILGLAPGVGDVAALAPSAYIWLEAHRMGVPTGVKAKMAANIGIDWLVGSIPLVGDLLDVGLKANRRNVRLLHHHFGRPVPEVLRDGAEV